jgi:hypothetical protein
MTKSMQQAEDEYFDRLWLEAEQLEKEQLAPKPQYNPVSKPKHYMLFEDKGIEVRDVIEKLVNKIREGQNVPFWKGVPMFESDYVQMMQYGMRFMDKGGVEDLKKMRVYLDKMIEAYDSNS